MSKVAPVIGFIFGAATGSFVTWQLLKKKYKTQLDAEVESVRKIYQNRPTIDNTLEKMKEKASEAATNFSKGVEAAVSGVHKNLEETAKVLKDHNYIPEVPEIPKRDTPYEISEDEFGELYDYNAVYLNYFADGVVSDSEYDILTKEEIEQSIGFECLESFSTKDVDAVWVRNDIRKCDYEITYDQRNYNELYISTMPEDV